MGRRLRCLLAHQLVEVTCRAIQGRFLLRPSPEANSQIKGTLGRAQRYFGLPVVACVFLSNHYHLLVVPESEKQLADFMRFLNTNLSKQLGRLHDWPGPLFGRRYQAIPVSEEPQAQVNRLCYLLEQGTKEDLVAHAADWPGVHCVRELVAGKTQLRGVWHERTRIWHARQSGRKLRAGEKITRETLHLTPLPAWESWSRRRRADIVRDLVAQIEDRLQTRRALEAPRILGIHAIRAQDPHGRPSSSKRSPAPIAHAATAEVWVAMKIAYRAFVSAYREASEMFRSGRRVEFPQGCFLPTGTFLARAGPG